MFKKFFKNKSNFLFKKYITKGSLNEILGNNKNIEKPLLLKIDIEGSEYRLLDEIISNQKLSEWINHRVSRCRFKSKQDK